MIKEVPAYLSLNTTLIAPLKDKYVGTCFATELIDNNINITIKKGLFRGGILNLELLNTVRGCKTTGHFSWQGQEDRSRFIIEFIVTNALAQFSKRFI